MDPGLNDYLYPGGSSHQRCSIKKAVVKVPVLESLFNKVAGLKEIPTQVFSHFEGHL